MKWFSLYCSVLIAVCLVACDDKGSHAEEVLRNALEALNKGDYDTYMSHVDYGAETDSASIMLMRDAIRQHCGWIAAKKGDVVAIDMVDTEMEEDTVCTVFYRYTFADGTEEVAAQKMVRSGGVWRLRVRN